MIVWRKLASAKWEDAWVERLAFLGPTRLIIVGLPGRKSLRIEAYDLTKREAEMMLKQFGGQVREINANSLAKPVPRKPLAIRDRLWVVESQEAAQRVGGSRPALIIPAAMAFGTGEHATTASCLRLLCDLAERHAKAGKRWELLDIGTGSGILAERHAKAGKRWELLDIGTGSGILAIAAKALGAWRAEGCDFDPHAVRTAKENVALNHAGPLPIRRTDVLKWSAPRQWDVVTANLFSQVLIGAAKTITSATRPGGFLILSGILRTQEKEVIAAFQECGFTFLKSVKKGKWVSLMAERVGGK